MLLSRRSFFGTIGTGAGALMQPQMLLAKSQPLVLMPPRFGQPEHRRLFGGFRPFRSGGFRLDIAAVSGRSGQHWINNYGHGGGGITLSWGCAVQVAEWIQNLPMPTSRPLKIRVLGAGVIGLTTAKLLIERLGASCSVTVHADKLTGRRPRRNGRGMELGTTSDNAGGQFEPSFSAFRDRATIEAARAISSSTDNFYSDDEIIRLSYNRFMADTAQNFYPVSMLPNYMTVPSRGTLAEPSSDNNLVRTRAALIGSSKKVAEVSGYPSEQAGPVEDVYIASPFLSDTRRGINCNYMIPTLLIEVPAMMKWLRDELKFNLVRGHFVDKAQVLDLFKEDSADVIINCLGCDGGVIAGYPSDIQPKLGVVLGLPSMYARGSSPAPRTHYLYGGLGYIFARADCTIVGGWKKSFKWSEYRNYDLGRNIRYVGQALDYYMTNFVNGKRGNNILECFTNDSLNMDNFDSTIDPDETIEMDGNHICSANPMIHLK
jgi:hypothetical protein